MGPEAPEGDGDLRVAPQIAEEAQQGAHALADDGGQGRPGDAHGGEGSEAENEQGVQDQVDDGAQALREHGVNGFSGGLEQPLKADLKHHAHRGHGNDGEVSVAVGDDLGHVGLEGHESPGEKAAQQGKSRPGAEGQKDAVDGGLVGCVKIFFSQALGQQGVDAHPGPHAHRDHQVLGGKGQAHGGEGIFADVGDEHAVHHVVEGLHQHGNHHGQGHGNEKPTHGHDAHLVFRRLTGLCAHAPSPRSRIRSVRRRTMVSRPRPLLTARW